MRVAGMPENMKREASWTSLDPSFSTDECMEDGALPLAHAPLLPSYRIHYDK